MQLFEKIQSQFLIKLFKKKKIIIPFLFVLEFYELKIMQ